MRLDDVGDPQIVRPCGVEVDVDVPARVDDRGHAGGLVGDERREMAETVDHELTEQHRAEGTTGEPTTEGVAVTAGPVVRW